MFVLITLYKFLSRKSKNIPTIRTENTKHLSSQHDSQPCSSGNDTEVENSEGVTSMTYISVVVHL